MTDRIKNIKNELLKKEYVNLRIDDDFVIEDKNYSEEIRCAIQLKETLSREEPVFSERDRFGFYRKYAKVAKYDKKFLSQGNIIANYERILRTGFKPISDSLTEKNDFEKAVKISIEALFDYCKKQQRAAKEVGNTALYEALNNVPYYGAKNFYEALLMIKIIIFTLRCNGSVHTPLGRFDQYLLPYYNISKKEMSYDELFEMLEEFFLALNFDTDLYHGIQKGDNGQSIVLGGYSLDGKDMFNELSQMCIDASKELLVIDPKINIRVNKTTPLERYIIGTELTAKGLGFPQYCNDDIVVPGMIRWGYAPEDAVNYGVAACWEYIPSGCGNDISNLRTMNFPLFVEKATKKYLLKSKTFEEFMDFVKSEEEAQCAFHISESERKSKTDALEFCPAPFLSMMIDGALEKSKDICFGSAKYNNIGFHGAGIATAADALAAIKLKVFEEGLAKETLLDALDKNFEGYEKLRNELLLCPKMGNNDDYVDSIAITLMENFVKSLEGKKTPHGGVYRAGTGSAMDYIFAADDVGATADGRRNKEPYASSFTPSMTTVKKGLLSVIQSFTKYDLTKIVNGGPLTIEVHNTVFRNEEGIEKTALLVKEFIKLGGHQLQINAINRDELIDAQKHPENHKNLIVRVWGWSGYFNELDKVYQDHIIERAEYKF